MPETWREWLAFHLIENVAAVLPKVFADEPAFSLSAAAYSATPLGQSTPRP
jgi:hypothetical protein